MDRVILHIDMNNFYASVETLYDPSLRDVPMAVGGDRERRHGIVLAKNMLAKEKGVKTAEALWEAERKCPGIRFVPPHFDRYAKYSRLAKSIYAQYTDMVESFGLDECWLDVTGSTRLFGSGREIAEEIGISKEEIVMALDAIQSPVSLFEPVYTEGGDTLYVMDQISDKKNREENWVEELSLSEAVQRLNERERHIIELRYFQGKTQMEVAREVGISQAQVSRLEKNALKNMRAYLQG